MTPVILCMSSYFKGIPFLRECKKLGAYVILVTIEDLRDEAWPRDCIDEFYMLPLKFLRQPDITKARTLLGWEPKVDLDAGLRSTIAYFDQLLAGGSV